MHVVLHRGGKEVWACLMESQTEPRERLHYGEPHCFVQSTSQTRKVMLGVSQKQVMFRFSALRYLWAILFLFFHQKWPNKMVRPLPGTKSLSHFYLHFPTAHRMDHVPLTLKVTSCSLSCLLGRKKRKLCVFFCHWFSHMKLISLPFSGSEAAVSKSAISLCFVSVSAGEILNSLCTKLFLNFILFWNFASLGLEHTGHPRLAVRALHTVWSGSVLICTSFPTQHPVSVRFP